MNYDLWNIQDLSRVDYHLFLRSDYCIPVRTFCLCWIHTFSGFYIDSHRLLLFNMCLVCERQTDRQTDSNSVSYRGLDHSRYDDSKDS
jgi:hypothetical protein